MPRGERLLRTVGGGMLGVGFAIIFIGCFQPFYPEYRIVLVVGSVIGGAFAFISWRDTSLTNAQDPPGMHMPPDCPPITGTQKEIGPQIGEK